MLRTIRSVLGLLLVAACVVTPRAVAETTAEGAVTGRVMGDDAPLSAAWVYAYQLADLSFRKVATDDQGRFRFDSLPAGLYKVIAHKPGFLPAVVMLTRATADAYQFLELELADERDQDASSPQEDFWSVRAQIPGDVLRDMTLAELRDVTLTSPLTRLTKLPGTFHAEMQALTGVDEIAAPTAGQLTGGKVGIEGRLGSLQVGLWGDYRQLQSRTVDRGVNGGTVNQMSALKLELVNGGDTRVDVRSVSNRSALAEGVGNAPVDFEHYRVSVSQALGEKSRSHFAAQYTSQSNFHRSGMLDPMEVPDASRSWRVEGSYTTHLSDRFSLETGLRYRERESAYGGDQPLSSLSSSPTQERVDLFGRGGFQLQPAVLVEYGLYTTLRDGTLSLTPRGGVVLKLGSTWQASAIASRRLEQPAADELHRDFLPTVYDESDPCEQGEEQCYELVFSRDDGEGDDLSVGAVHREFGDTMRLYFSDDLFNRQESLFLVPGDRVPEVRFAVSRRLGPKVVTRLRSNVASGGGGIFYASDQEPYENRVRYLVTSLDTRFEGTETGVFISFHHLEQELDPSGITSSGGAPAQMETERLQVMLTQDLNILLDLSTDWALQLNMELSKATTSFDHANAGDEFRKRILGGIAIRF